MKVGNDKKLKNKRKREKPMRHSLFKARKKGPAFFSALFWKRHQIIVALAVAVIFGITGVRLLMRTPAVNTSDILFPSDANIVDVTKAPYNAKGDGVSDDSDALLQAFLDNDYITDGSDPNLAVDRGAPRTVYLPAGTYLVSKTLAIEGSSLRITGAGRGKTIIKLIDNTPAFGSASNPKYVLETGSADFLTTNLANSGFGNYVENLTIDIGSGNPGASGVRYYVANHGSMQHIDIKSSDPNRVGKYGIGFITGAGPGFIQDVIVTGFSYGVYLDGATNNVLTFQDLRLENQIQAGIYDDAKNIVLENLVSVDNPVTIKTESSSAAVMIIDSILDGKGSGPAINMPVKGFLYLRDVTSSDYSNIITIGSTNSFVGRSSLTEWSSENYRVGGTTKTWTENNPYVGLHLPIKKAPEYYSNDFSTWANVQKQTPAATAGTGPSDPANNDDDGPAIQAAIDSGAETVYFPYGYYTVRSSVHIRGNVKRIDFLHSRLDGVKADFIVDGVNGNSVILENLDTGIHIVQNSSDSVVARDINGGDFDTGSNATGDLFVENTGAHTNFNITKPISVWARSIDRTNADWVNSGGTFWVLSSNIESDMSHSSTTNAGKTEIIGGTADNLAQIHTVADGALFISQNSYMSVFMPGSLRNNTPTGELARWDYFVNDQSSAGTFNFYNADKVVLSDNGANQKFVFPMYVTPGYSYSASTDTTRPTISITAPGNGSTQSGTVTITANASDNVMVTKVEFLIDGVVKATDTSNPYSYNWDTTTVSNGSHNLLAKAYDAAGNVGSSSIVTVTVSNASSGSADFNGDHIVNILDLSILSSNYGQSSRMHSQGDVNGDTIVNILDLSLLSSHWGLSQ